MRISTLIAATCAILALPAAAFAEPINQTEFTADVAHDDLDLTTRRGVAQLDERVRTIIRRACANGGRDSASIQLERECRTGAQAAAEQQVRLAVRQAGAQRARLAANPAREASRSANPGA